LIKILADKYLFGLQELKPQHGELETFDPERGLPADVTGFDALLIRTVNKINKSTLPKAGRLKFVGSATAGTDHVDGAHLANLGIRMAHAPGCNANAVGEYVLTSLLHWADLNKMERDELNVGVVGCGHTGSSVIGYLDKLGIVHVDYDPPKNEREAGFESAGFEELMACNVLTFHVPLTESGPHPTAHLCSRTWLRHPFGLVINASRGGVVDERALLAAKGEGLLKDVVLDVWENEPRFWDRAASEAVIATPHIAGYSKESKWRATRMIMEQVTDFFELDGSFPPFAADEIEEPVTLNNSGDLAGFLWSNHKIEYYDQQLRELIGKSEDDKANQFADLRSNTELRVEFRTIIDRYSDSKKLPDEVSIF
jgi:erythronate-4-phosphate dehydrogenase